VTEKIGPFRETVHRRASRRGVEPLEGRIYWHGQKRYRPFCQRDPDGQPSRSVPTGSVPNEWPPV